MHLNEGQVVYSQLASTYQHVTDVPHRLCASLVHCCKDGFHVEVAVGGGSRTHVNRLVRHANVQLREGTVVTDDSFRP